MNDKIKYGRRFILLNQEDSGYGNINSPSGYIKFEAKADKYRVSTMIQDFNTKAEMYNCNLYIISCKGNRFRAACIGRVPLIGGKGEAFWDIDPQNIKGSRVSLQDYDVIIILLEDKSDQGNKIICPLAAYSNEKIEWRKKFLDYRLNGLIEYERININEKVISSNSYIKEAEDIVTAGTGVINSPSIQEEDHKINDIKLLAEDTDSFGVNDDIDISDGKISSNDYFDMDNNYDIQNNDDARNADTGDMDNGPESYGENNIETREEDIRQNTEDTCTNCFMYNSCPGVNMPYNSDVCNAYVQGNVQNTEPEDRGQQKQENVMEEFTKCMNSLFEVNEPFGSKRRDYTWWKINSPVQLNNVLYRINLRNSILFNPKVLMAHFKYRHLIVGIYKNTARRRQYIVYGVPGVYGIEDRPFGNICRWAQVEGNRPRYGAFGYWLIYLDPETGKIINVM